VKTEPVLSAKEAKAAGYSALTLPYQTPRETKALEAVLSDLRRGRIDACIVECGIGSFEVWRKYRIGTPGANHPTGN